MKTKQEFFNMADKYQSDVIKFLLENPNRLILIRGVKFIGKSTIVNKIFDGTNNVTVIYHTGCDPTKRDMAHTYFEKTLNEYKDKKCLVVLDEFYYPETCEYLNKHKNFKVLLFVNTYDLTIPGFKHFNLMDVYEQYKEHFFEGQDLDYKNKNIRELVYIFDNPQFDPEDYVATQNRQEKMRRGSNSTQTKIKENNILKVETITFEQPIKVVKTTEKIIQK